MKTGIVALTLAAALGAAGDKPRGTALDPARPVLQGCQVSLIEEAQVPAQEAGVLTSIKVREGMQVAQDSLMAQIDDRPSIIAREAAIAEKAASEEQAKDDINVRFSDAAAKVAKADYDMAVDSNRRVPGSVAVAEVNQRQLAWTKATLGIEQAALQQRVAGLTAKAKQAEVDKAENDIARRKILAPFEGVVVQVFKHAGEWLQPGEAVLHLVRVDRLRVQGVISAKQFDPQEINDKPVVIEIDLARGRKEKFEGKVVFVSPIVELGGDYAVWAEVTNKQENGQWLLRPGSTADMTIQVK